jgi:hypothetical protein
VGEILSDEVLHVDGPLPKEVFYIRKMDLLVPMPVEGRE